MTVLLQSACALRFSDLGSALCGPGSVYCRSLSVGPPNGFTQIFRYRLRRLAVTLGVDCLLQQGSFGIVRGLMMHTRTAVILAAGDCLRLRAVLPVGPKALLRVGPESLLQRSTRLLRLHGVERIVIVVGQNAPLSALREAAGDAQWVVNPSPAAAGSMASLQCALQHVREDFLLLESDLLYERRALEIILAHRENDVILASDFTAAGDEVWLEARAGYVHAMSKNRCALQHVSGELVGICRLSKTAGDLLRNIINPGLSYDMDGLGVIATGRPLALACVNGLVWGEVDDPQHLWRLHNVIWPAIALREGARVPASVTAATAAAFECA